MLIQNNMENYWKLVATTKLLTVQSANGCIKTFSTIPDHFLNSVLAVSFNEEDTRNHVAKIVKFYEEKKISFAWWVSPNTQSASLCQQLEAHHFSYFGILEGMEADLTKMDLSNASLSNSSIGLSKVSGADFDAWVTPIADAFHLSEAGKNEFAGVFKKLEQHPSESFQHYMALQDNKVVSSCTIFLDEKTNSVGVYNCGTMPEARRQGILTALVQQGLLNARNLGYQKAVLQATVYSKRLFGEMGFEPRNPYKLYTK